MFPGRQMFAAIDMSIVCRVGTVLVLPFQYGYYKSIRIGTVVLVSSPFLTKEIVGMP